jgi:hypothetical protein
MCILALPDNESGWARAHRFRNSADSYRKARAVPLLSASHRCPAPVTFLPFVPESRRDRTPHGCGTPGAWKRISPSIWEGYEKNG